MNSSNTATLSQADIAAAISAGIDERNRRAQQAAHEAAELVRRKVEEAPQRAADILAGIPAAIAQAVAESDDTPRTVNVMWVDTLEYDGNVVQPLGLGYRGGWSGEPERLKLAAKTVWEALAPLGVELRYQNRGGIYRIGRLGIFLRLS